MAPSTQQDEEEIDHELNVEVDKGDEQEDEENTYTMTSIGVQSMPSGSADTHSGVVDLSQGSLITAEAPDVTHDLPPEAKDSVMDVHQDQPPLTKLSEMETQSDPIACPNGLPIDHPTSEIDTADKEKGLKRKLGDRATSLGPNDAAAAIKVTSALDPFKHPLDNHEKHVDFKEAKKPTPPPETAQESNQESTSLPDSNFVSMIYFCQIMANSY
jgi:Ran-binding protein 3